MESKRQLFDQLQEFSTAASMNPAAPFEVDNRTHPRRDQWQNGVPDPKRESGELTRAACALLANELPWERRQCAGLSLR